MFVDVPPWEGGCKENDNVLLYTVLQVYAELIGKIPVLHVTV